MKPQHNIVGALVALFLLSLAWVPEALAFRGRGAAFVVGAAVGSSKAEGAEAEAAAAQQQAAASQQQAAAAQQQAATAQAAAGRREGEDRRGPEGGGGRQEGRCGRTRAGRRPDPRCRWAPSWPPFPRDALRPRWAA